MSIASGYGPNWTTAEGRAVELQRRVVELEKQLAAAQAKLAEWEEKNRQWEMTSLCRIVEQRDAAQAEARNWKRIAEDATHVEREELTRLRGLLGAARCPNCDGSGVFYYGPTSNGDWEAEQCQWCYEKQEALAAGGDA